MIAKHPGILLRVNVAEIKPRCREATSILDYHITRIRNRLSIDIT